MTSAEFDIYMKFIYNEFDLTIPELDAKIKLYDPDTDTPISAYTYDGSNTYKRNNLNEVSRILSPVLQEFDRVKACALNTCELNLDKCNINFSELTRLMNTIKRKNDKVNEHITETTIDYVSRIMSSIKMIEQIIKPLQSIQSGGKKTRKHVKRSRKRTRRHKKRIHNKQ